MKENKKGLTLPGPLRVRDDLPKIIWSSPAGYSLFCYYFRKAIKYWTPRGYTEYKWDMIHMKDLKDTKEAVVYYACIHHMWCKL